METGESLMTNIQPIVSIIMPVKNAEKYIHECLSSIRGQTFSFWELLIVNDHSTDNSQSIVEEFVQVDHRIRSLPNKGNGIIPALQLAFQHCQGTYITRMDADDIMPKNRLELMVNTLENSEPDSIVTGKVEYFGSTPISPGYLNYQNWLNERAEKGDHWQWIYRECVVASPNWMIRTEDLNLSNLSYPEDYHLVLKWYEMGYNIQSINETTLNWREHPERTSRNSLHYHQEAFFNLKVNHFIRHKLGSDQLVLWGTGQKGRLTADILRDQGIEFVWMDIDPKNQIVDYREIEKTTNFKLLIAVFPEGKAMEHLLSYLERIQLKMGENYWFL